MDKQSKAPGVYRVILCALTLAPAPVFYAIWQPYNTCLLQLPWIGAAGCGWLLWVSSPAAYGWRCCFTAGA